MTILVTGGCGFIGTNFIREWIASIQEAVVNLDCLTYAGNAHNLSDVAASPLYSFRRASIGDAAAVRDLLSRYDVRAIVNFAAESHVDRSIAHADAFVETNVVATQRLLETARAHHQALSGEARAHFRFLHISTDEVYGSLPANADPFTERSPFRPNSPYAASKAASDHLVRATNVTYGLPTLTINCSNNYGEYQYPEKLIPLVITSALAGRPLPIYGDGKQIRDWLYVADHCRAVRDVLAGGRPGETYNVGGDGEKTNIEVVNAICRVLDDLRPRPDGISYAAQIAFVRDRPGHDRRYAVDFTKIRKELGWRPAMKFEDGIRRTVRWYLDNPDWISATEGRRVSSEAR